jgi:hypothetical protein
VAEQGDAPVADGLPGALELLARLLAEFLRMGEPDDHVVIFEPLAEKGSDDVHRGPGFSCPSRHVQKYAGGLPAKKFVNLPACSPLVVKQ